MLLKLNLRKLEGVLKGMLSHFPVSRKVKTSSWYKRIIGASREYEEEMNKEFFQLLLKTLKAQYQLK